MAADAPRIPATVRARIDQALVEAERVLTEAEAQPATGEAFPGGFIFRLYPAIDRLLVPTTVDVLATAADALSAAARRYAWTADRLRAAVDRLRDETTARLFEYLPPPRSVTIEQFRQEVSRTARRTPWWQTYLSTLEERSVAVIPFHLHLRAVLDEIGWTKDQFAERTGVDRTNVYDAWDGTSLPRKSIARYEEVCSAELGWPVGFVLPPKSSRTT